MQNKNEKPRPLNGQTPYSRRTVNINGKSYTVNETRDSNGNVVYVGITEKFLGIF